MKYLFMLMLFISCSHIEIIEPDNKDTKTSYAIVEKDLKNKWVFELDLDSDHIRFLVDKNEKCRINENYIGWVSRSCIKDTGMGEIYMCLDDYGDVPNTLGVLTIRLYAIAYFSSKRECETGLMLAKFAWNKEEL